jgi:YcxB-like protein
MITFRGKLQSADIIKAMYLHMRPRPWLKYLGIALLSLYIVFLTTGSLLVGFGKFFSLFGPPLLFVLFAVFFVFISIHRNARLTFSQQKTIQDEHETMISPEMIESTSETGTMRLRLSDFYKYKVGKDLILLYQSHLLFHIFPRHFFTSEEDFKTVLSYLQATLGSPKR